MTSIRALRGPTPVTLLTVALAHGPTGMAHVTLAQRPAGLNAARPSMLHVPQSILVGQTHERRPPSAKSVRERIAAQLRRLPAIDRPVGSIQAWGGALLDHSVIELDRLEESWAAKARLTVAKEIADLGELAVMTLLDLVLQPRQAHPDVLASALCQMETMSARAAVTVVAGSPRAALFARAVCAAHLRRQDDSGRLGVLPHCVWVALATRQAASALLPWATTEDRPRLARSQAWADRLGGLAARATAEAILRSTTDLAAADEAALMSIAASPGPSWRTRSSDLFRLAREHCRAQQGQTPCLLLSAWGDVCHARPPSKLEQLATLAPVLGKMSLDYAKMVSGHQAPRRTFLDLVETRFVVQADALRARVGQVSFVYGLDPRTGQWAPAYATWAVDLGTELTSAATPPLLPRVLAWANASANRPAESPPTPNGNTTHEK